MNRYLIDLAWAFQQVPSRYYGNLALNENNDEYQQNLEHNFTSEIVRHFRNNMDSIYNTQSYYGLNLDFDINKARVGMKPDLVLHNKNNNNHAQVFFVEVKTNPNADLTSDILKLLRALTELEYDSAVMIVVNKEFNNAIRQINAVMNQYIGWPFAKKLFLYHSCLTNNRANFTFTNFQDIKF